MANRFENPIGNPIEEVKPPDPYQEESLAKEAKENPDLKLSGNKKEELRKTFKKHHSEKN
ncbi:MAG: hypothetical protein A2644_01735 [Candidatus Zambryskibacteria bacterium RIFCSPHIGHO2_01_FULL_39_63]|uniref:Uncharacterized protein n=1 Tax=Candidatus Staskawiczbacteria bacterium RIFCSPHIGHO2_12_FULL_38_11 TaxID=1802209 RepID=A0A1G2I7C8_9BACT|nr:MAG: hypothetical protein A3F47_00295 [Candidatus Staskawiczbacteria bacterium RIFCSPHIGHO2_12_FULL_38_11]OHA87416.1 MAG: hypothetical protein A2644_01735 [Candidatus Zambryskibacteria bacterium RIFCSPHIGHO2_01_FULL_39_63]